MLELKGYKWLKTKDNTKHLLFSHLFSHPIIPLSTPDYLII